VCIDLEPDGRGNVKFEITLTQTAAEHVRSFRKYEQQIILDAIAEQLAHEPTVETRNRKRLGENELSDWELRVDDIRVFYDVFLDDRQCTVKIKAVGRKDHGVLRIGDKEVRL
jgi:mRNA-degrading endonuclease RelE of RelBE toxin-antitoxin system